MSIGVISISTNAKRESGAPFVAGSARNGDSIDSTGRIVLGNDENAASRLAQLLNNREIPTSDVVSGTPFYVTFDDWANVSEMRIDGQNLSFVATGGNDLAIFSGSTFMVSSTGLPGLVTSAGINTSNGFWQIGPVGGVLLVYNGAVLQVNGPVTNTLFNSAIGGAYNFDLDLDNAKSFNNPNAAATITVPNTSLRSGIHFWAECDNAAGLTIQASNQVIRSGASTSTLGGTITTTTVGSAVHIIQTQAAVLNAVTMTGVWSFT